MTTLTDRLAEAAVAAIRDVGPTLEQDARRVRYLTVELELANAGEVVGAVAWIERRLDVRRLLGEGAPTCAPRKV